MDLFASPIVESLLSAETLVVWATNAVLVTFLLVTIIGICRFIRRQFKARVNCWFCNRNTWVPYLDRNQWHCPDCEQYNGFTEDGDYNRDLPAQYSPKYNKPLVPRAQYNLPQHSPGTGQLCEACARNQELKVHQLASFTASDERSYDAEVEQYREHLEEVHRLCPACERLVKRRLNQAKTLIFGMKGRPTRRREKPEKRPGRFGKRVKTLFRQVLILLVVLLLARYFVNLQVIKGALDFPPLDFLLTDSSPSEDGYGLGYRMSLGLIVLVLLGKGRPMSGTEYVSVVSLCCLHFVIGEGVLKGTQAYSVLSPHMLIIEWALRVVALLSTVTMFVESVRRSPAAAIKLNNSFHKIQMDDEDADDEVASNGRDTFNDTLSTSYLRSHLDTSTDFGSVFEYPPSVASSSRPFPDEDEEIRNISLNSRHQRSFQNLSDPQQYQEALWQKNGEVVDAGDHQGWGPSATRSTMNLHSPPKLFPDDRFSNSIKSMRIGSEYHQLAAGKGSRPEMNPFMRNIPVSGSKSQLSRSSATICGSSRSLSTPSRLSLVSGGGGGGGSSAFEGRSGGSSWLASSPPGSGFWNNQFPNVFTAKATSFALVPPRTMAAHSMDRGLNDRFIPLSESRSSSQSSGFESRQSSSSCQMPAFQPIGELSPERAESICSSGSGWKTSETGPWSEKASIGGGGGSSSSSRRRNGLRGGLDTMGSLSLEPDALVR